MNILWFYMYHPILKKLPDIKISVKDTALNESCYENESINDE